MSNNTTVDPNEIAQEGQPETGLDTESKSNESQDILTEKEAEYVETDGGKNPDESEAKHNELSEAGGEENKNPGDDEGQNGEDGSANPNGSSINSDSGSPNTDKTPSKEDGNANPKKPSQERKRKDKKSKHWPKCRKLKFVKRWEELDVKLDAINQALQVLSRSVQEIKDGFVVPNEPTSENPYCDDEIKKEIKECGKMLLVCTSKTEIISESIKGLANKIDKLVPEKIQYVNDPNILDNIKVDMQQINRSIQDMEKNIGNQIKGSTKHTTDTEQHLLNEFEEMNNEMRTTNSELNNLTQNFSNEMKRSRAEMNKFHEEMRTRMDSLTGLTADFSQEYDKWWFKVGTHSYGLLGDIKKIAKDAIENGNVDILKLSHERIVANIEKFVQKVNDSDPRGGTKNA